MPVRHPLPDPETAGITWLETEGLVHPEARRAGPAGQLPFLWRIGRLGGKAADEQRQLELLFDAAAIAPPDRQTFRAAYARWVVAATPGGAARLSGAAARRWWAGALPAVRADSVDPSPAEANS
jgi:hypothetical protein